jgi:hypothetical protein
MWMEERIGKRINTERIDEALALDPDTISTACPYCLVMLGDAVAAKKGTGQAKDSLEVIDVAQLLARSVRPQRGTSALTGAAERLGIGVCEAFVRAEVGERLTARHRLRCARGRRPPLGSPMQQRQRWFGQLYPGRAHQLAAAGDRGRKSYR